MRPDEVRMSVRSDHDKLRALLTELERTARIALAGKPLPRGVLRGEAKALLTSLASHMSWEDRYLVPIVRQNRGLGERRCAKIAEDHHEQRALLEYALRQLHDEFRPECIVAGNLLDLIALLRSDMDEEESAILKNSFH
ncbi:MAG: hemerythrin domain-containing protein [Deltaproteobacteria bacterium]|nr:hemerythrin domain-containing protein [Deltaproteobacteria bacterium]MBW2696777.1 hemerythrin domain-containing protein [Deltaproteobacteria bacterium]